jgi:glycosyltransferase involved in cell wall biosynthesis
VRRRVLVLTRDLVPYPGLATSGGGLRAWGLGEALRGCGHEVVYSVPRQLVPPGEAAEPLRQMAFELGDLHSVLLRAEPDVLLIEQWGLATYLQEASLPLILDLHGSLVLENAFRQHRSLTSNAAAKIKALRKADLVICPGVRQRAYFAAWMMMAGADPRAIPVAVVPVAMPPTLPAHGPFEPGPATVVYGGQLWPWIDSRTALVAAVDALRETGGELQLYVQEPRSVHLLPFDSSTRVAAAALPEEVRRASVVRLHEMVPRDELLARYAQAHLALDVYACNSERELAVTTRTVEYLWCGLPVVYGNYGELAALIADYKAGWVVPPDDGEAIRRTLVEALSDPAELARRSSNAQRLVRERLAWDRTIEPLDRFVRDPIARDKGATIFGQLSLEFDRLGSEAQRRIAALENEVERLHEELARQRQILQEQEAQQRRELADANREMRRLESANRETHEHAGVLEQRLRVATERLHCEQQDHAQTAGRYEQTRAGLGAARRSLAEKDQELALLRTDLKQAAARIAQQSEELEGRCERLEGQLAEAARRELELRQDLAACAVRCDEADAQVRSAEQQRDRAREERQALERTMHELRSETLQRATSTGQHLWRRAARQVPALAGLWVRNLANNAYMKVWQRRHNVRIFPGE